jgi:hypothetical protein
MTGETLLSPLSRLQTCFRRSCKPRVGYVWRKKTAGSRYSLGAVSLMTWARSAANCSSLVTPDSTSLRGWQVSNMVRGKDTICMCAPRTTALFQTLGCRLKICLSAVVYRHGAAIPDLNSSPASTEIQLSRKGDHGTTRHWNQRLPETPPDGHATKWTASAGRAITSHPALFHF